VTPSRKSNAIRAYEAHHVTHGRRAGTPKRAFHDRAEAVDWLSKYNDGHGSPYECPSCKLWHVTLRAVPR
jgi:hypothetical protein